MGNMGRIMVPEGARSDLTEMMHSSHQGETKALALARELYYWAAMVKDRKNEV